LGVKGNERADHLANREQQFPSGRVINNMLNPAECASQFKISWEVSVMANFSKCSKSTIQCRSKPGILEWQFDKSRQNSILLHRIRSGHNRLNSTSSDSTKEPIPAAASGVRSWKTPSISSSIARNWSTTGKNLPVFSPKTNCRSFSRLCRDATQIWTVSRSSKLGTF